MYKTQNKANIFANHIWIRFVAQNDVCLFRLVYFLHYYDIKTRIATKIALYAMLWRCITSVDYKQ